MWSVSGSDLRQKGREMTLRASKNQAHDHSTRSQTKSHGALSKFLRKCDFSTVTNGSLRNR